MALPDNLVRASQTHDHQWKMEVKQFKGNFLSNHFDNSFDFPVAEDNDTEVSSVAPPTPRKAPPTASSIAPTTQTDPKTDHVPSTVGQSDSAENDVIAVENVSSAVRG